jgi:hypothetical protein
VVLAVRGRLEVEVEALHKERLEQRCYSERLNQQTLFRCQAARHLGLCGCRR